MPILWFEQRVTTTPELAEELAVALKVPMIGQICSIIVIIIGLIMLLWFPVTKLVRRYLASNQVHISEKGVLKIITMEELEKQGKIPENSPLLESNKKEISLKNVEFTKSSKQDLRQSLEKLAYIDSSDSNQNNDKNLSISLMNCDSNKTIEEEHDSKTKL